MPVESARIACNYILASCCYVQLMRLSHAESARLFRLLCKSGLYSCTPILVLLKRFRSSSHSKRSDLHLRGVLGTTQSRAPVERRILGKEQFFGQARSRRQIFAFFCDFIILRFTFISLLFHFRSILTPFRRKN